MSLPGSAFRRSATAVAVAVAVATVPASPSTAAQDPAEFSANAELVLVSVAAIDRDGTAVTDLSVGDFELLVDGAPRPIELFLRPKSSPANIVFLVDVSESLQPWAPTVREVALEFLDALPPSHCVLVLPFNDRVGVGSWLRPADASLARQIRRLDVGGGTAVYDAMIRGLAELDVARTPTCEAEAGGVPRRGAMVLLSDGEDRDSVRRPSEVAAGARARGVPVFAVTIGNMRWLGGLLDELADLTGGRYYRVFRRFELSEAYEDIVGAISSSYLVGFAPGEAPGWHDIEIAVAGDRHRLIHRRGYQR